MTYDQWKLRSPDDDASHGVSWGVKRGGIGMWGTIDPRCEICGSTEDDGGQEWARGDWVDGAGDRIEPFGWCPNCGWRCEACPDIEDLYERSGS